MAKKSKVLTYFSTMKDDELLVLTHTIINAMDNNTHFQNPVPALVDIQLLLNEFIDKLKVSRKRGSPEDTALKNESRLPLTADLQRLGNYVNSVSKGQLSVLLSSGFPTNSVASPIVVPTRTENVLLRDGRQSGQVRVDFAAQKDVLLYEYCYRLVGDNTEWSDRFSTSSSKANIIAPLQIGASYEVKVRGVNRQGPGDWSNTVQILVR